MCRGSARSTRQRIARHARSRAAESADGVAPDGRLEAPVLGGCDRPGHSCGASGYCAGLKSSAGALAGDGGVPPSWSGFTPAPQTCLPSASVLQPCFSLLGSVAGASAAGLLPPHADTPAARPASARATSCFESFTYFSFEVPAKRRNVALLQDPFRKRGRSRQFRVGRSRGFDVGDGDWARDYLHPAQEEPGSFDSSG